MCCNVLLVFRAARACGVQHPINLYAVISVISRNAQQHLLPKF
jgi:hypothetical protein